jgi:hypothetical protein
MRPDDPTVQRLRRHLAAVKARHPAAWNQLAEFRRRKQELGGWPGWCDVPLSGAYAIVTGVHPKAGRPSAADVAVVGGLEECIDAALGQALQQMLEEPLPSGPGSGCATRFA